MIPQLCCYESLKLQENTKKISAKRSKNLPATPNKFLLAKSMSGMVTRPLAYTRGEWKEERDRSYSYVLSSERS